MPQKKQTTNTDSVTIDLQPLLMPTAHLIGSIVIAAAIVIGLNGLELNIPTTSNTATVNQPSGNSNDTAENGNSQPETVTVAIGDDAVLGDRSSAKVAIVEFSDYNCGVCTRYHQGAFKDIVDEYVQGGEVISVYKDFAGVGGETTVAAANAAECVRAQTSDSTFYGLISEIYATSETRDAALVRNLAQNYQGVDINELDSCIENETFVEEVTADRTTGIDIGVGGTPNFVIGVIQENGTVEGQLVGGLQPISTFRQIIDGQLARV